MKYNIEFVIQEMVDVAEQQIEKLKEYNDYLGISLDDILFDLKRTIFLNQLDQQYESQEELAATDNEEWNCSSAELIENIDQIQITDKHYKFKYNDLLRVYWDVQSEV